MDERCWAELERIDQLFVALQAQRIKALIANDKATVARVRGEVDKLENQRDAILFQMSEEL